MRSRLWIGAVVLLAFLAGFVRDFSGDFHWHVVQGAWMLDHRAILRADVFSSTFRGQPERVDAWLADVILAVAYRALGYAGCYAVRGAALALAFFLLAREMVRRGMAASHAAVVLALILGELLFRFYLRPETLTFPIFAAILALLGGHERTGERRLLYAIPPLVALWSNVHASVLIALLAIGLYSAELALRRPRADSLRAAVALPLASFAASMLNPNGAKEPLMFLAVRADDPTYHAGVEWLPLDLSTVTLLFPAFVGFVAALTVLAGRRASPWRTALALLLFAVTLEYGRFIKVFLLASALLVASDLAAIRVLGRAWSLAGRAVLGAGALGAVLLLLVVRRMPWEIGLGLDPGVYPERACAFAKTAPLEGRMLNSFDIGSYLMFCLPDHPVFIDQRAAELYSPAFSRDYYAARGSSARVRAYADAMDVSWVFLVYRDAFATEVAADPETWRLVYFDDEALIYVKRGKSNGVVPFDVLDPMHAWRMAFLTPRADERARTELQRLEVECPGCVVVRLMRAELALGRHDFASFDAAPRDAGGRFESAWRIMQALRDLARAGATPTAWLGAIPTSTLSLDEAAALAAEGLAWRGDLSSADQILGARGAAHGTDGGAIGRARAYVAALRPGQRAASSGTEP